MSDPRTSPFNRLPAELDKPLDLGNGLVSASVSRRGDLLSVGTAHASLGFVEWSAVPEFDESLRLRPDAVRRHREAMARDRYPVVEIGGPAGPSFRVETTLIDGMFPRQRRLHEGWSHEVVTWAREGERAVRQRHTLRLLERAPDGLAITCRGRIDRPALAEITETNPLDPTGARTRVTPEGSGVVFEATALPAYAFVDVVASTPLSEWEIDDATATLRIDCKRGDLVLDLVCSLSEVRAAARGVSTRAPENALARERVRARTSFGNRSPAIDRHDPLEVPDDLRPRLDWLTLRALNYVHRCSAVTVSPSEVCLLTDHRLLPLSWTRDAYYQAWLLLADGAEASRGLVAAHLRWLWTRCERPDGRWARSHLPSGAIKGRGLQADQQLYPLLELCDYHAATGELPELGRNAGGWDELVTEAWAALPVHEEVGLLAGEENPADDPLELPYLLSNQILWWGTSVRLRALQAATGIASGIDFRSVAESVRARVRQHFCVPGPTAVQWVYATDARGATALYNDANDLPTAFAPMLGYCAPDDVLWRATMEFTFGPDNAAYCSGPRGGLGSVHTPGTWPLGDIQEWVAFSLVGERERALRALRRLLDAATSDGMFPEAYDPHSGRIATRHWFAWPGAVLGALYIGGARRVLGGPGREQ